LPTRAFGRNCWRTRRSWPSWKPAKRSATGCVAWRGARCDEIPRAEILRGGKRSQVGGRPEIKTEVFRDCAEQAKGTGGNVTAKIRDKRLVAPKSAQAKGKKAKKNQKDEIGAGPKANKRVGAARLSKKCKEPTGTGRGEIPATRSAIVCARAGAPPGGRLLSNQSRVGPGFARHRIAIISAAGRARVWRAARVKADGLDRHARRRPEPNPKRCAVSLFHRYIPSARCCYKINCRSPRSIQGSPWRFAGGSDFRAGARARFFC